MIFLFFSFTLLFRQAYKELYFLLVQYFSIRFLSIIRLADQSFYSISVISLNITLKTLACAEKSSKTAASMGYIPAKTKILKSNSSIDFIFCSHRTIFALNASFLLESSQLTFPPYLYNVSVCCNLIIAVSNLSA